jgi:hypothetical protein
MRIRGRIGREKAGNMLRRLWEKPWKILVLGLLAAVLLVFWQAVLVLGLLVIFILVIVKLLYEGPSLKELMAQKRTLLTEIDILEKNYMKRKISKREFIELFRKKQTKLIEMEALIDEKFNKEKLPAKTARGVEELAARKKHLVAELLGEKKRTLKEMEIAQRHYLKRKFDAATYQKIISEKRQRLIELEAQLQQIYGEESISQVMEELKQRLALVERQRKQQLKERRKTKYREESEIAAQIAEQVESIR